MNRIVQDEKIMEFESYYFTYNPEQLEDDEVSFDYPKRSRTLASQKKGRNIYIKKYGLFC